MNSSICLSLVWCIGQSICNHFGLAIKLFNSKKSSNDDKLAVNDLLIIYIAYKNIATTFVIVDTTSSLKFCLHRNGGNYLLFVQMHTWQGKDGWKVLEVMSQTNSFSKEMKRHEKQLVAQIPPEPFRSKVSNWETYGLSDAF